jgi:hypothetical protein
MAHFWKRIFAKSDHLSEAIEKAVEIQADVERKHPVAYASDQRFRALCRHATAAFGSTLPSSGVELLKAASVEWTRASAAAEEVK